MSSTVQGGVPTLDKTLIFPLVITVKSDCMASGLEEREVMKKVREWLGTEVRRVVLAAFVVCMAWLFIVEIVMTPIQWWNGDCTVEYSKQWVAIPFHFLLEPRCKLIDDEELDDEEIDDEELEKQKGRRD
jgi:hypothetical protein